MSDYERLKENQNQFLAQVKTVYADIAQVTDFKSGKSQDFVNIYNKVNGKLLSYMESLVQDADKAISTNQVLEIKYNNVTQELEAYKSSYNTISGVFENVINNYRELFSVAIQLSFSYYQSLVEHEKIQGIINQNHHLEEENKKLKRAIRNYKEMFISLYSESIGINKITKVTEKSDDYMEKIHKQNEEKKELEASNAEYKAKIEELEKELETAKENAEKSEELDKVKADLESITMNKTLLEGKLKSLRQKTMESETKHAEEIEYYKNQISKIESEKNEVEINLEKYKKASSHWKGQMEKYKARHDTLIEEHAKEIEQLKQNITFGEFNEDHPPPELPAVSAVEENEQPGESIVDPATEKVDLPPPLEAQNDNANKEEEQNDNQEEEQQNEEGEKQEQNEESGNKEEGNQNKEEEEQKENEEDNQEQEQNE